MANNKTDYLEGKIVEHVLRNVAYTSPTSVFAALFTAAPGEAAGGTEVSASGTAYARQAITFGAHSGGQVANSAAVNFPTATGAGYGTVTDMAIFDAATVGNMLYYGTLAASKIVAAGDSIGFAIGALTVQEL